MRRCLDAWLDLLHGVECAGCGSPGRSLCHACDAALPVRGRRVRPTPCPPGLADCFAAGEYAGLLRALLLAHKEQGVFSLAMPLGRALAVAVSRALPDDVDVLTVLVPVPSRPAVVRARSHDPVLRMSRYAARQLRSAGHGVRVLGVLEQGGLVADQAGLGAGDRAANLDGSMGVRRSARASLAGARTRVSLVVCDDILTTGATAREAQRALADAGLAPRAVATVAASRKRGKPFGEALPLSGLSD